MHYHAILKQSLCLWLPLKIITNNMTSSYNLLKEGSMGRGIFHGRVPGSFISVFFSRMWGYSNIILFLIITKWNSKMRIPQKSILLHFEKHFFSVMNVWCLHLRPTLSEIKEEMIHLGEVILTFQPSKHHLKSDLYQDECAKNTFSKKENEK